MRGKSIYLTRAEMEAVQTAISAVLAGEIDGAEDADDADQLRAGMERVQEKLWR